MPVIRTFRGRVTALQAIAGLCLVASWSASAHEYWLSPVEYHIDVGQPLLVDTRNGEDFVGNAFPYDPFRYTSLYIARAEDRIPVRSRRGDSPAVNVRMEQPGRHLVVLDSTERRLTYDSWDTFVDFLDYHGFDSVAQQHVDSGFSQDAVQERYFRHAKSLVSVDLPAGNNAGETSAANSATEDPILAPQGQTLEIVLLGNPYANNDRLAMSLLYDGEPVRHRQIEIFHRKDDRVARTVTQSDERGRATLDISAAGEYLINAVHLSLSEQPDSHWVSRWASFTFAIEDD